MEVREGVTEEVAEKLLAFQPRCIHCGGTYMMQIHHRIFKSEGNEVLVMNLKEMLPIYEMSYNRKLELWDSIHDIQNLCVLCLECHEGKTGVHGGNERLRQALRHSFTCPITGFNVPFYKANLIF